MSITAKIVIDGLILPIDKPYSYLVPDALLPQAKIGSRVKVPFGRGNREMQGLIIELVSVPQSKELKSVHTVIDEQPILDEKLLALVGYLKETTFCTWFDAVRAVLPYGICCRIVESYTLCDGADISSLEGDELRVAQAVKSSDGISKEKLCRISGITEDSSLIPLLVKKGIITRSDMAIRNTGDAVQKMLRLTETGDAEDISGLKLTPKQKQALSVLRDVGCCSARELCYFSGVGAAVVNGLVKKGAAELYEEMYYRSPSGPVAKRTPVPSLTDDQQKAYMKLSALLDAGKPAVSLLYGVTGSGKTQVYMKLCEHALEAGRGVIVMVPEIALTPQTVNKFRSAFGDKVAVFHSAMSQGKRLDEWKRVRDGKATVAIGTRSAVFAPVRDLGLIVMDEEQEHTYKSEMSPRFHTRDVAKYRAAAENAVLLLASATPSLESYSAAKQGRYTLCELGRRYGKAKLPEVRTVDMRTPENSLAGAISTELRQEICDALDGGHQVILLLNRRGRNTFVSCPKCGYVIKCENCSLAMTYHSANNRLMCHYCGASEPYVSKCPECGSEHIRYGGWGTQKIEEELGELFPDARVLRMDSDSTMTRDSYEKKLSAFGAGEYDIMLGTQMVAKGLDFPNVTLVGVISADQSMYSTDFRGFEKTFSLLTQVVGRSGRGDESGVALIQTAFPDSDVIRLAAKQDYPGFYEDEIKLRKLMVYPPYCDIAQITVQGADAGETENAARRLLTAISGLCGGSYSDVKIIVLGPTPAAIPKVGGKFRWRMMIKCRNGKRMREMLTAAIASEEEASRGKTTVSVDMNPETLI